MSLLGGIFVLLGGLIWALVGTIIAIFSGVGFLLYVFLLFGIVIIVGAVVMNSSPRLTQTWGIVIIVLGVLSLIGVVTTLGGVLAIIGGALAVSWKPQNQ